MENLTELLLTDKELYILNVILGHVQPSEQVNSLLNKTITLNEHLGYADYVKLGVYINGYSAQHKVHQDAEIVLKFEEN